MNHLKTVIIILFIVIIIVSICLVFLFKGKENIEPDIQKEELLEESTSLQEVTNATKFYAVSNCISAYLDKCNLNNTSYYGYDNNGNYTMVADMNEIKNEIYSILDKNYIDKNNIKSDHVLDYIDKIDKKVFYTPLKMNVLQKEDFETYAVYGFIQDINYNYIRDIYAIVKFDIKEGTFSIEPITKSISNINEIQISTDNIEIPKNEINTLQIQVLGYEGQCKNYINNFKRIILGNTDLAYHYLDEAYRKKRFETKDKFQDYITNNKEEIKQIRLDKYLVNNYEDHIEFVCKDQYNNIYTFEEKTPMQISVKLDTYTLETDKFKQTYHAADTQKKVMMNIDKWTMMLNSRDYEAAYQVLDETFRKNTFGSATKFEQYMRKQYPLHYAIEYKEYKEEANISIFTIKLSDITKEDDEVKELKIIMQVKEDTDFTMSFEL